MDDFLFDCWRALVHGIYGERASFQLLPIRGLKPGGCKKRESKILIGAVSIILSLCHIAGASVRLPLEGYCRSGRFFPIFLGGSDAEKAIVFSADGCMSCRVETGSRIVPMLAIGTGHALHWDNESIPLHALGENERLVASTNGNLDPILFPGNRLISISLDPVDLLTGPQAAWETLDAISLDSPMYDRISDVQRSAFLAGGMKLVATGDRPDFRWPWRRQGSIWILSTTILGPGDALIDDIAYTPTYGWTPGWTGQMRGQVMGIATLFLLISIAILLLRRTRAAAIVVIFFSLLSAIGIACWQQSLGSVDRAGGDIIVAGQGLIQRDNWVYQHAKRASIQTVPWAGWTHPVFASPAGMNYANMQIHVSANDQMSFVYQASKGTTAAFVRREIQPGTMPAVSSGDRSPMRDAANSDYLGPGLKVVGETPGIGDRWPGVVISK